LDGHAKQVLQASGNGFEAFPTGYIQEVIVLGIDGTCDRVIGCNSCHGLIGNLPIFPFNMDIVDGSFPHWMILGKGNYKLSLVMEKDKTKWIIGVLVWPKTVCNHHYKTLAQVWLLV
jgi:hypothetical protein